MATLIVSIALAALLWRLARAFARDMRSGCCAAGGCSGRCAGCCGCSACAARAPRGGKKHRI